MTKRTTDTSIKSRLLAELTKGQTRAVQSDKRSVLVVAGAGSGKTEVMARRVAWWVGVEKVPKDKIVAFTFTEKAAGELKMRLREELEKNLKGNQLRDALADLERAHITTIHALCAWILRERPIEAVVDPQFAVADELQRQLLFEDAWEKWHSTVPQRSR